MKSLISCAMNLSLSIILLSLRKVWWKRWKSHQTFWTSATSFKDLGRKHNHNCWVKGFVHCHFFQIPGKLKGHRLLFCLSVAPLIFIHSILLIISPWFELIVFKSKRTQVETTANTQSTLLYFLSLHLWKSLCVLKILSHSWLFLWP